MEKNLRDLWLPLLLLGLALLAWAGLFALGAYLELGADRPRYDIRKPMVVLASMALFLGVWGFLLWKRASGSRRK
jgi:hypothetical protein